MQFKRRLKKDAAIDIASLVDIVFLLLLFFVVTTTFRESPGLNMDLPETTSEAGVRLKEVVIRIILEGDDAAIFLMEDKVSIGELPERLKTLLAKQDEEDRSVIVEADRNVRFKIVFDVLDIARQSGATNITFPAIFKRGEAAADSR
ncbi:MAG TPA: biopolymer transporter ExbD [Acidobacteriota bacterium]|nr:biopolymer transporter ExbD [Acidobacteriota bacterium]